MRMLVLIVLFEFASAATAQTTPPRQFIFGRDTGEVTTATTRPSISPIHIGLAFEMEKPTSGLSIGYGFEPRSDVKFLPGCAVSDKPFFFSVAVPEGNYKVTVVLGDPAGTSNTTIKAELRRLMVENVSTAQGESVTRTFIVNVRRPEYPGGKVKLKSPRETTDEAWAWDEKLTLEFNGSRPAVQSIEVAAVDVPTVFILGDSTVCDQSKEPYASWGQMLPRFFKPEVAIANHAESGETVLGSTNAHRFDKVLSSMKAGDYLLMQFGHNDMKSKDPHGLAVYQSNLKKWVEQVKGKGGVPILITPMNRHTFEDGVVTNSLGEYPEAVRRLAKDQNVPLIDLNAMSKTLYEALGPERSVRLFARGDVDPVKYDHTHHGPYGAYQLAKCVADGIRSISVLLAQSVSEDLGSFAPTKPDAVEAFEVPPSPGAQGARPLGD